MAKDSKGIELQKGDTVLIEATVSVVGEKDQIAISIENWNWISCPSRKVTKVTLENSDKIGEVIP